MVVRRSSKSPNLLATVPAARLGTDQLRQALRDQLVSALGSVLVEQRCVRCRMPQTRLQVGERRSLLRRHHGARVAEVVETEVRAAGDGRCLLEVGRDRGGPHLALDVGWEEQALLARSGVSFQVLLDDRDEVRGDRDVPDAGL